MSADLERALASMQSTREAAHAAAIIFERLRSNGVYRDLPEPGEMFRTRDGDTAICLRAPGDEHIFLVLRRERHGSGYSHVIVRFSGDWLGVCNDTNVDTPHVFDIIEKTGRLV